MSGTQFDALPYDEGRRWELLGGELIEMPSPTPRHQDIVFLIQTALRHYLAASGHQGRVYADVEFALSSNDRRRPDVCVLLAEKSVSLDLDRIPIPGAPDIAIEVISPTERAVASYGKVRTCLRNGTAEVWQVYPDTRTVQVYIGETSHSIDFDQQVTSGLLPGFASPVAAFFEKARVHQPTVQRGAVFTAWKL
jgi:Uma2 family endonuclease